MESTCKPGMLQVSEATHALLPEGERFEATGGIEVKVRENSHTVVTR